MVFSYRINYIPYHMVWYLVKLFRPRNRCIIHIEDSFDYFLFGSIAKYLPPMDIVVNSRKIILHLKQFVLPNTKIFIYPFCFPDAVIMFRNAAWKYPVAKIVKIGLEHGAYNFKRFPKTYYYNLFDLYLMTSSADEQRLRARGATTVKAIGYPKSDALFKGLYTSEFLARSRNQLKLDNTKPTLLFSSTWDGSGMSAIHKWYDRIESIKDRYNLLVTLHPRMSQKYVDYFCQISGIRFIEDSDIYPYIIIADVCIGDTNSLIAEFCIVDKPIITFSIEPTQRTMDDVIQLISSISVRIDDFSELEDGIRTAMQTGIEGSLQRQSVIKTLIDPLDGQAGIRAAEAILELLSSRGSYVN